VDDKTTHRETWWIDSTGGRRLFVRGFRPPPPFGPETPGVSLAIVPGFSDHSGRYEPIVARLRSRLARPLHVFAVDTRGHGRSDGPRGHIERFDDFLDDVDALLADVQRLRPADPLFLYGHSMGGLIVLSYLASRRLAARALAGGVAGSSWLRLAARLPPLKVKAARALSRLVPWFPMKSDLDVRWLSRDEAVGAAYLADPLVHRTATPRLYTEVTARGARLLAGPLDLPCPVLFYHGGGDRVTDPAATREAYERAVAPEKKLAIYDGAYHEVHNDPANDDLARDLAAWIDAHAPAPGAAAAPGAPAAAPQARTSPFESPA